MCGFFGVFVSGGGVSASFPESHCVAAMNALRHRGPDYSARRDLICVWGAGVPIGQLSVGHCRLSIIDLSRGGDQPVSSKDGRVTLIYNGEIYNYVEIRAELASSGVSFESESDSEVLLAAWATWGQSSLSRLNGMFAFAVFDSDTSDLTLVRDAFGIKPLFYSLESHSICFASEIPALLALTGVNPVENTAATYRYLTWGQYDDTSATFFDGVRQLPPGHYLRVNLKELAKGRPVAAPIRWWSPPASSQKSISFGDAADNVRQLFLSNLRKHLRSDVPLAVSLSGGIDSSAVLCGVRHIEPDIPINTFSYVARGFDSDEEPWADLANSAARAVSHKVIIDSGEVVADIDDMIRSQGEPFGGTSIYAQYRVYKAMREHGFIVALEGQGADEVFAGYNWFVGSRLHSLIEMGLWSEAFSFLASWSRWPGRAVTEGLALTVAELTNGALYSALSKVIGRNPAPQWLNTNLLSDQGIRLGDFKKLPTLSLSGRRMISKLSQALTERGLPALLRHGDRNAMRFSVENRVPFLTTDQVEFALSLPERYLISSGGETKSVLRGAMRGIVPDAILNRRDKIGFKTPERQWILALLNNLDGLLDPKNFPPLLDYRVVRTELQAFKRGRGAPADQVWRWINYIRWHRHFFK